MKSAICLSDSVGKTIEKVESIYSGEIVILFADGTFSLICLNKYEEDYCYCPNVKNIKDWALKSGGHAAIDLGICTKEEQESYREAEKVRLNKLRDKEEQREYERLKAKFNGK